jgi:hypothetical protein
VPEASQLALDALVAPAGIVPDHPLYQPGRSRVDGWAAGPVRVSPVAGDLLQKDARLMLHTSDEPLPAVGVAFETLTDAVRAGHGEEDFSAMASADCG